jgi:hypothetical protein
MGDVVNQKARRAQAFRFVFKRKIFLPARYSDETSDDPMFERLVYLQVRHPSPSPQAPSLNHMSMR